jgi:dCMP deaminase
MDFDLDPNSSGYPGNVRLREAIDQLNNRTRLEMIPEQEKWDRRFLRMAEEYASWSKDPSTKIGCVVVDPAKRRVLSGGYNGFPRGIKDTKERLENREVKYKYVVHAEMNAIYNATLNGVSLEGATLYCVGLPTCSACALGVIQVGIKRVVIGSPAVIPDHWQEHWALTKSMLDEVGINHKFYHDWKHE